VTIAARAFDGSKKILRRGSQGSRPGQLVHREPAADHTTQRVVEQDAIRLVDVVLGGLPRLQQRRHR
jgi:hypothetical protein